jgi:hypothetical protein
LQAVDNGVERRQHGGTGGDFAGNDLLLGFGHRAEEHLSLVGEVVEERPAGEPGPLGDRRALEPLLSASRPSPPRYQ